MAVGTVFAVKPLVLARFAALDRSCCKLEVLKADDIVRRIVFAEKIRKLRGVRCSEQSRQDRADFLFVTFVKTVISR